MSLAGTCKSFNTTKGWGFVTHNGTDYFCHIQDCVGGAPKQGDTLYFDIGTSEKQPGKQCAKNISGGTEPRRGVMGDGSNQGTVKSFNELKGWGFITMADGTDVFVHLSECKGGNPKQGDTVAFEIALDDKGKKKATNVTGGSLPQWNAGGKGKGWGKGGDWMWMGGYSPYGGWGKGKGKGWGW